MAFPSTSVLDSFNRANESPVANSTWTSLIDDDDFGGLALVSNALTTSFQGDNASSYWSAANFGPDCEAYITLSNTAGGQRRLYLRVANIASSSITGYLAHIDETGFYELYRIDSDASQVFLDSGTTAFSAGDKFGIQAVGSTITGWLFQSGTWTKVMEASDATYSNAGRIGVRMTSTQPTQPIIDDFGGGDVIFTLLPTPTNKDFEVDASGWSSTLANISRSTAQAYTGSASLLVDPTASGGSADSASQIAATPNTNYRFKAWIYPINGGAVRMGFNEFTSSPSYIQTQQANSATLTADTWQLVTFTGAPTDAGCAFVQPFIGRVAGPTDDFYIDNVDDPQSIEPTRIPLPSTGIRTRW